MVINLLNLESAEKIRQIEEDWSTRNQEILEQKLEFKDKFDALNDRIQVLETDLLHERTKR
jgi:hypothetical protein